MKSYCKITFSGLNVNRIFNTLCKQNVALLGVERNGRICTVCVAKKHCAKVVALLKEKCYNIDKIEYSGSLAILNFCKKRCVLCVFLALAVLAAYAMSNFCLKITVVGDYPEAEVLQALGNSGVKQGTSLADFDADKLENALAVNLGAMYAVVTRKGSCLYVNAVRPKTAEPPIDVHSKRDIVSQAKGKVLSVLCEQGTSLVAAGDFVNAGDVLIAGQRRFADGSCEDVYALGRVVIEVYSAGFAPFDGTKTVTERTGNSKTVCGVKLLGTTYAEVSPYPCFDTETSSAYLYPLNLEIVKITYFETQKATVTASLEECKTELTQVALKKARENCGFNVLDTQINVKNNGVEVILSGQIEVR